LLFFIIDRSCYDNLRFMRTVRIAAALISAFLVQGAFAQDATPTESMTGSGTTTESGSVRTMQDIASDIRALLPGRNPMRLKDVVVPEQKQKAWDNESAQARERLAQHRRDCREAIRKANRDQLMDRLLSCYRSDLLQDVNIMRKRQQYIAAVPSLDAEIRMAASGAMMKQIDAQMTIVNAIDSGVFTQIESVEEAKRNLRVNYREATWISLLHLQADRELTFLLFILKDIEERIADPAFSGAKADLAEKALQCMETSASMLLEARSGAVRSDTTAKLLEARTMLQTCRSTLKNLARKEQQEQAEN
jgi:hypothetical protein